MDHIAYLECILSSNCPQAAFFSSFQVYTDFKITRDTTSKISNE